MPRWSSCCSPTSVSTSTPRTTGTSGLGGRWHGVGTHARTRAHAHAHTHARALMMKAPENPGIRFILYFILIYLFLFIYFIYLFHLFIYYLQAKYSARNQNSAQTHARAHARTKTGFKNRIWRVSFMYLFFIYCKQSIVYTVETHAYTRARASVLVHNTRMF